MNGRLLTQTPAAASAAEDVELAGVLESYLADLDAGRVVDRAALLAAHPHLAERLEACLTSLQFVERAGGEIRSGPLAESLGEERATLGDFRLLREIGRGGMGVVYEAEQLSLGRRVAVKVLPFAGMLDERQLARFKNEARAAASLHHGHIVPVFYVGAERGVHYYAMQYIEGQSLAEAAGELRISDGGLRNDDEGIAPADLSSAIRNPQSAIATQPIVALSTLPDFDTPSYFHTIAELGVQAAEALHYAHESGVIHRDVKPSNLLVDSRGHLWIADFGLARIGVDPTLTMTGDLVGTLRYMSPEQVRGKATMVDHRTDVYSLGVTLYELLTGRPAFGETNSELLLRQVLEAEPSAPRSVHKSISMDLETIVLKAMRKDAEARYATARELADDLARHLAGKPIIARRLSGVDRVKAWSRRHAAMLSMGMAALTMVTITCLAAVFFAYSAYRAESQQRAVAEASLLTAGKAIDRALARASNSRFNEGNLADAEKLAIDAADMYEELLKRSNDGKLRFQAAQAYHDIAKIWNLVDKHERIEKAAKRSLALLTPLVNEFPDHPEYRCARGIAHTQVAVPLQRHGRYDEVQLHVKQAITDFEQLIAKFPNEPSYREYLGNSLADAAGLLQSTRRYDESEKAYQRYVANFDALPTDFSNRPEIQTRHAGVLNNWALLCRERGDLDRATKLLDQAIQLQGRSLKQAPNNPMARDFLHKHYDLLAWTHVLAGRYDSAASTVELLVKEFPDHLSAYHAAVGTLLVCADRVDESRASTVNRSDVQSTVPNEGDVYRQQARELVALARHASTRTPESKKDFAWLLVLSTDRSIRDPAFARELAIDAVKETPQRPDPWMTLALAEYRCGKWEAAEKAIATAVKDLPEGVKGHTYALLLRAMIRWQQGQPDEARQLYEQAGKNVDHRAYFDVRTLAAEANELINERAADSSEGANNSN